MPQKTRFSVARVGVRRDVRLGLGAARARDPFEQAKEKASCIVSIDEPEVVRTIRGGVGFIRGAMIGSKP